MPGGNDEDATLSRADEQGLTGEHSNFWQNVIENKGHIFPTEEQTVATGKLTQMQIVKSFKRKQRWSTVRKRNLKRPRLTEATSHDDFGDGVCKAYNRKYQKENTEHNHLSLTLGGCIYKLAVRFLEFTDFGAIQVLSVTPRICVWKGSMVKNFSDMLIDENGMYKPSKIKDESETCYAQESFSWASTTKNSNLRAAIARTVGNSINEKVKEDIFASFEFYMKDKNVSTCMKAKTLLLKTLQLVTSATDDSQKTVKLESSENNHNSADELHCKGKVLFHDDDTPTLRLFENWDDCANEITEPELWRPLHMNDEDYNRKIENAKKSIVQHNKEQGETSNYEETKEIKSSEVFEHCAQQPNSVARRCFSPRPLSVITLDGVIIDLTTPNANIHHGWAEAHTCYSPRNRNTSFKKTTTTPPSSKNNPITFLDHNTASPDVQILTHRYFKQSCNNAVNRSDDHYNTKLMLGSTSSFSGKENRPPKRIVQPSRYVCSPYDNQDTGPIMEHEVKLYKNILVLSENDYYRSGLAIEIDRCIVSMKQLGNSFTPGGWVEAYVINAYCRKLLRDNQPRTSQRHYFFHTSADYFLEKWRTKEGRLTFKDKALKSFIGAGKARRLELSNELLLPSIHKRHLFIFLVDLKARMFIFLDSKYEENNMFHKNIKDMMMIFLFSHIDNFIQTWRDSHLTNMWFSQFQTTYRALPKQDDSDACGIFTLMKMQSYRARNPMQTLF
ncbi:hypothetical protein ZWY2020_030389 [Hordeum vulgare]|nr:hypothetical protein ZWY2020_030389 [Hordeum vulgare]